MADEHVNPSPKKKNWFERHKVLTVIGLIILLGIVVSAGNGDKSPNKSNNGSSSSSSKTSKTATKKATLAKIGEAANDGKFQFTVNSIKCGETTIGDQYLNKTAQGQFCRLNLTVKNIGNEAQGLSSSDQYLYNSAGQKYKADDTATLYAAPSGASSTWYNDINPGNSVVGDILFDIPKDQTPVTAELHDSAFSGGVKVNLQ